ncbi:hypothetical protein AB4Y45_35470 [Paraburkholderia sp. EG287A]|uniref:hypothetical protein n=1 Tax=Paraburkholderia sp. EG287A TaxID=3237012 RepID=UPI0034D19F54
MTDTTTKKTKLTDEQIAQRVEAARARAADKQAEARECEDALAVFTGETIEREGLTIAHFRSRTLTPFIAAQEHMGGVSVAYRHKRANTFIEIATAICRDDEVFNRKLGRQAAVDQFARGRVIRVPLYGRAAADVVAEMFDNVTISMPDHTTFVVNH